MEPITNSELPRRWIVALFFIFSLALALRLVNIYVGYWGDELTTVWVSRLDITSLVLDRISNGHTPFYFIFIKYWVQLFGAGKWAYRIPGIIAGSISPVLMMVILRRWLSLPVIILMGIVLACNNLNIFISHTARMYAITSLLEILFFYSLIISIHHKSIKHFIIYWCVVFCGCLIHALFFRLALVSISILVTYYWLYGSSNPNYVYNKRLTYKLFSVCLPFVVSFLIIQCIFMYINYIDINFKELPPQYELVQDKIPPPEPLGLPSNPNSAGREIVLPKFSQIKTFSNLAIVPFGAEKAKPAGLIEGIDNPGPLMLIIAILCSVLVSSAIVINFSNDPSGYKTIYKSKYSRWILFSAFLWAFIPACLSVFWDFLNHHNILGPRYICGSTFGIALLMSVGLASLGIKFRNRILLIVLFLLVPIYFAWVGIHYVSEGQEEVAKYWSMHRSNFEKTYLVHAGYWAETLKQSNIHISFMGNIGGTARLDFSSEKIKERLQNFAGDSDSFWVLIFPNNLSQYQKALGLLSDHYQITESMQYSRSSAFHLRKLMDQKSKKKSPEDQHRQKTAGILRL